MDRLRLFNNLGIHRRLHGIVARLGGHNGLHDDMMQEALIHLWRVEEKRPGQSQAWYLQACRLHLQNYLRRGRSVDSSKHRKPGAEMVNDNHTDEPPNALDSGAAFWEELNAKDVVAVLLPWLTALERKVLDCLADGLSARELAKRIHISHTRVLTARRQIALLARQLGIVLPGNQSPVRQSSAGEPRDVGKNG